MKVGDRVRIVESADFYVHDELQPGKTGVISHMSDGGRAYEVRMDSGHADVEGDDTWPFYGHELEVIQ